MVLSLFELILLLVLVLIVIQLALNLVTLDNRVIVVLLLLLVLFLLFRPRLHISDAEHLRPAVASLHEQASDHRWAPRIRS